MEVPLQAFSQEDMISQCQYRPLVTPLKGDTSLYDYPEKWTIFPLEEILRFRLRLVHGKLYNLKRQAKVILFRESYPNYSLPTGVWLVRESYRRAFRKNPVKFSSLKEAVDFITSKLKVPLRKWINSSIILEETLKSKKITDFSAYVKRNDEIFL